MSDRPVFLYAAIYDEIGDAEADYDAVFDLHDVGAIGTFDSAVIRKDEDGKVRVTKTEKPTQHGAWTGAGVGALVGIVFPPAILGAAIVGAARKRVRGRASGARPYGGRSCPDRRRSERRAAHLRAGGAASSGRAAVGLASRW